MWNKIFALIEWTYILSYFQSMVILVCLPPTLFIKCSILYISDIFSGFYLGFCHVTSDETMQMEVTLTEKDRLIHLSYQTCVLSISQNYSAY